MKNLLNGYNMHEERLSAWGGGLCMARGNLHGEGVSEWGRKCLHGGCLHWGGGVCLAGGCQSGVLTSVLSFIMCCTVLFCQCFLN